MLQRIMALFLVDLQAAADGSLDITKVQDFANLGYGGRHPQHMNKQLTDSLRGHQLPSPHNFMVPLRHTVLGYFYRALDMVLPHELFAAIFHFYPAAWISSICPGPETVQKFWRSVQNGIQFANHPVRNRANFRTHCIPLSIHGDGTPVVGIGKAWGKIMDLWSWCSLLVLAPTILRQMLIFCLHNALQSVKAGHNSLDVAFTKMAWSFTALWEGKWPVIDWKGKPMHYAKAGSDLAGGYFACVWALIGDLDYWRAALKLPNSTSVSGPCPLCPCNSTNIPWHHFSEDAQWIQMIYTIQQWLLAGWATCVLFTIPGVNNHSLHPDWMHAKHLGSDKVLLGSVLYCLVHFVLTGSVEDNLTEVWTCIGEFYKEMKPECKFGSLKLTMFSTRSSPKLKGKAAEVKDLVPVLHRVWLKFYDSNLETHRNIEIALRTSAHLDAILGANAGEFVLPPMDADDILATGLAHLSVLWELRQHFATEEYPLFQLTQKGHYLMHCCILARELNPRLSWCYGGEDFMGKTRDLALSCARGASMWNVSHKMVMKYLIALHLTFEDPQMWFHRRV